MSRRIFIAVVCVTILGCPSSPDSDVSSVSPEVAGAQRPQPDHAKLWVKMCTQARDRFTAPRFDERPDFEVESVWMIVWKGIKLPIPTVRYSDVRFDHGATAGQIELKLTSLDPPVTVSIYAAQPRPDGSGWREMRGRDPFTGHPSTIATLDAAFGDHTALIAEDMARRSSTKLTCTPDRAAQELPTTFAWQLATRVNLGEPPEYFDVQNEGYQGYAERQSVGESVRWKVVLLRNAPAEAPLVIEYVVPKDSTVADIGGVVGGPFVTSPHPPPWLLPSGTLLDSPTQTSVDLVLEAFNRVALDPESRLSLLEVQRVIVGEKPWAAPSTPKKIEKRKKNAVTF